MTQQRHNSGSSHECHDHNHHHDGKGHIHSHGHGHDHTHGIGGHHHHYDIEGNKRGLAIALTITFGIMFLEFFGGLFTNSLALLSDSGHMLSDVSALLLSLMAMWFATKKAASSQKTFGFYRFEILAALFNGIGLFVIAGFILWEGIQRFAAPPEVQSGYMMLIAFVGLVANLVSAYALMKQGDVKTNVNLRSAYLHILGDALGSFGAVLAGLLIYLFNWYIADPIISILVSLLILKSAWNVITHTVHILMEGAPSHVNHEDVKTALEQIDGVLNVHDLHIWTITSNFDSLSCHMMIEDGQDCLTILQKAIREVEQKFNISHSTIQVENSQIQHRDLKV